MAKKKYIKDSRGMTVAVTTDTLGLEKPLLNENYDIDVHNRNMDKIDEDLKPIDDSYIIELFQHDGDTTNPRDYYTKVEADEKFATKEEANNALNKANEAFQRGDNVKTQLVDKLISEGQNVSTDNTFEELIGGIALGKKCASGSATISKNNLQKIDTLLDFTPTKIFVKINGNNISANGNYVKSKDIFISNIGQPVLASSTGSAYCYIQNITAESFEINFTTATITPFETEWYAFQ